MQRYSFKNPPPATLWAKNYARGQWHGLTHRAASAYATLTWWGEHYGIPTPEIVSGKRDAEYQKELRARWDRGDRAGLVVRPALDSHHTRGEAFDLRRVAGLATLGWLAPHAGLRWGGNFKEPDPVHFDLG